MFLFFSIPSRTSSGRHPPLQSVSKLNTAFQGKGCEKIKKWMPWFLETDGKKFSILPDTKKDASATLQKRQAEASFSCLMVIGRQGMPRHAASLQRALLQMLYKVIDTPHFLGHVYALGAMRYTLLAAYAMIGLPQAGNRAVIAYQKSATSLFVVFSLPALRHVPFVDTFVIVQQDARNVQAIRTRHAIVATITSDGGILHHQIRRVEQILLFLICQWL